MKSRDQYALVKRLDALELAVNGLIMQQRALAGIPDLVVDQVKLSELRWNLVLASGCGQQAMENAKRELEDYADYIAKKHGKVANG